MFYSSGLIPLNVSKLLPEILHLNTDGHIPQIVFHSLGVRSRADFLLCFKSSDMDIANKAFDGIFPFAVLSANEVGMYVELTMLQVLQYRQ